MHFLLNFASLISMLCWDSNFTQNLRAQWEIGEMWRRLSSLSRGAVYVLLFMFICSATVSIVKSMEFELACRSSRKFVQVAVAPLREGKFDEVIQVVKTCKRSHIARVVVSGLARWVTVTPQQSVQQALDSTQLALQQSTEEIRKEMKRGLILLATTASTAPFVGLFGTVIGIMYSFRGISMERATALAYTAGGIAEALVTAGIGLLVAIPAVWFYNFFCNKVEVSNLEMENASLELSSFLLIYLRKEKQQRCSS